MTSQQFAYRKLNALKELSSKVKIFADNPYEKGEKPYEKEEIFFLFSLLHVENLPKIAFSCIVICLDWYFPDWKKFASPDVIGQIVVRRDLRVKQWKRDVFERDSFTCVECGNTTNIHAHHICGWAKYPELRLEVDNGETLCGVCHHKRHPEMSRRLFNINNN